MNNIRLSEAGSQVQGSKDWVSSKVLQMQNGQTLQQGLDEGDADSDRR